LPVLDALALPAAAQLGDQATFFVLSACAGNLAHHLATEVVTIG
jgi:hypothetical protein